ncbi:MAG: transcription termination factor NusA, partial [Thermodesulfobacteriota bacterium]
RGIVADVRKDSKGPQVVMSRTHPDFLTQLFKMEVPEIYEGIVEVKGAAREPGDRAKIAVCSHNSEVDPVGACVGVKGSRVQSVVQELKGEKIDIVHWSDDQPIFVKNTLSPAQISRVVVDEEEHSMEVIVPDDQLSLAIGKKGQNVRLAVRLTGWRIDISTETDSTEGQERPLTPDEALRKEVELADAALESSGNIASLEGVGPKTVEQLKEAGFDSIEKIASATVATLTEVDGIGPKKAEKLLESALEKSEKEAV